MKLATKVLLGYLGVTSVILHIVCIGFLVWFIPILREGWKMGEQFGQALQGNAANATVKDVSTFKDGGYSYAGYAVEYQGQTLYVAGAGEQFKIGDQVVVVTQKHPHEPLKSMIVMVLKNGP